MPPNNFVHLNNKDITTDPTVSFHQLPRQASSHALAILVMEVLQARQCVEKVDGGIKFV